jgi:hypothetical protein
MKTRLLLGVTTLLTTLSAHAGDLIRAVIPLRDSLNFTESEISQIKSVVDEDDAMKVTAGENFVIYLNTGIPREAELLEML